MKLYYTKGACSLVVRIVINEIGLPTEFESVDLAAKKTESGKDFLKINPKGSVPALETDDGDLLTENAVILQYLADKAHATQLLPPIGDFKRYRVLEWLNFITTELHKSIGFLFKQNLDPQTRDQIIVPLIKSKLTYVDQQLGDKQYLLGESFTLPDAYLFVMLTWLRHFKIDVKEWPHLACYFGELKKRSSIEQSLAEEKLTEAAH